MPGRISIRIAFALVLSALLDGGAAECLAGEVPPTVLDLLEARCLGCHDGASRKGGLDLSAPGPDFADAEVFARWAKVHDRVESGEMPPRGRERPTPEESRALLGWLERALTDTEDARLAASGMRAPRRLTRSEYENTVRELLDLPGAALAALLPPDGSAHGFDKNAEALGLSHVHLARYIEAAEHALDLAIATRPTAPAVQKSRLSLVDRGGFDAYLSMQGDAVLLRDGKPDPEYPPAGRLKHNDQGAHEAMGSFETGSTVGVFRREEESVSHYFRGHTTFDPGWYRVRASFWAFQWDRGRVLPARRTEAARLSVVQLTGDGRGGQHPSYTLGYYDAPSPAPAEHERLVWLNRNEILGFDVASLAPVANYNRKGRAMAFAGPGIAVDRVDVEGPIHQSWPPRSHKLLFGDLPIVRFQPERNPGVRKPRRDEPRWLGLGSLGKNHPDPVAGTWTVRSDAPRADADRLLASFLPRAFRRPVAEEVRLRYVERVGRRLEAGDCFETAMRSAYLAALCSPDFLHHVEPGGGLDDHALACRLAYFLWNSPPDEALGSLADSGELRRPGVLRAQAERLLADPRSRRFIEDFLGQWLKLRSIAANDPDRKLYPEFNPYLQDSMVAETHAYFRELLDRDLDVGHLVRSDFAMLNEALADHYGVAGVSGPEIRRVPLPPDCPRGGLLTQASILKVTANGTTTSPVPRGAFVIDRLLGRPPEPPPASVPAVEPDVRGATTIREQLARHRADPGCAGCHARIDPPGFALESFDVIGGYRTRYRSLEIGDPAPRGKIDPFIGIVFRLGPPVDPSGVLPDGRPFRDVRELQSRLADDRATLLKNLARRWLAYATGREPAFRDRKALDAIASRAERRGGGVRSLLLEVIQDPLFQAR